MIDKDSMNTLYTCGVLDGCCMLVTYCTVWSCMYSFIVIHMRSTCLILYKRVVRVC